VPVYSHQRYDIVTGEVQTIRKPDIVIVEGLNVLQPPPAQALSKSRLYVSDFFDFSIYVDANETDIEKWYVDRFLELRVTAFSDPASYHHHYAALSEADAVRTAKRIWADINGKNLRENIAPTKPRADLVLHKGADHLVREVLLRRL
jgi:type I pantothenate kinase